MIEQILNPQILNALGWTLIHSLWQVALVAVLLALVLLVLRKSSARLRYNVAISSLLVSFCLFAITFGYYLMTENNVKEEIIILNEGKVEVYEILVENDLINDIESTEYQSNFTTVFYDYFNTHLPIIVTLWFMGLTLFVIRFLGGLAFVQRLKHSNHNPLNEEWEMVLDEVKSKLQINKMVDLVESSLVHVPMVVGYLKPMILMPIGAINYLTVEEVEAIFAHELAHIKRYDYFVNLLQSIIETILFYHPAIWWISSEIRRERENCCDDLALEVTGNSLTLAKALSKLEQYRMNFVNRKIQLSMTALKNKNQLLQRIQRILNEPQNNNNATLKGFFAAVILIICFFATSLDAQKESPTTPTSPESPTVESVLPMPETPKAPKANFPTVIEGNISIPSPEFPKFENPPMPVEPVLPTNLSTPVEPLKPVLRIQPIEGIRPQLPLYPKTPEAISSLSIFPEMDKIVINNEKLKRISLSNFDEIYIKKDSIIDDEVKEIILIKTVKENNEAAKEIKISIKKNGEKEDITVYENGRKLSDKEAQKYKDDNIEIDIIGLKGSANERRKESERYKVEMEMKHLERQMQAEERKMKAEERAMMAEQRKMMAEERKRLAQEQVRLKKEMEASRAEMMKSVELMKKEQAQEMKRLEKEQQKMRFESEKLRKKSKEKAKEKSKDASGSSDNFRTSINGWTEAVEDLEKTIGISNSTTTTSTTTVKGLGLTNEGWFDDFVKVLQKDGILKEDISNLHIKMTEDFMKVNGKKLSKVQAKKYYKLYEKLSGTKIDGKVEIRKSTKSF